MNERIVKLRDDYERNENKITALQAKNKKLAEKIRQLENTEIIGAVRGSGLSIDELVRLLGKDKTINENELEEQDNEI